LEVGLRYQPGDPGYQGGQRQHRQQHVSHGGDAPLRRQGIQTGV